MGSKQPADPDGHPTPLSPLGQVPPSAGRVRVSWSIPFGREPARGQLLSAILVEAAGSVGLLHGKNYLAEQQARLLHRRGMARAQVAIAHSMLVTAYHMLTRDEPYRDLGANWYLRRNEELHTRRLVAQLQRLALRVVLDAARNAASTVASDLQVRAAGHTRAGTMQLAKPGGRGPRPGHAQRQDRGRVRTSLPGQYGQQPLTRRIKCHASGSHSTTGTRFRLSKQWMLRAEGTAGFAVPPRR